MTRKDYEAIATAIREARTEKIEGCEVVYKYEVLDRLIDYLAQDNPLFNADRFWLACHKEGASNGRTKDS